MFRLLYTLWCSGNYSTPIIIRIKIYWYWLWSNQGPSACKTDVLTTTLQHQLTLPVLRDSYKGRIKGNTYMFRLRYLPYTLWSSCYCHYCIPLRWSGYCTITLYHYDVHVMDYCIPATVYHYDAHVTVYHVHYTIMMFMLQTTMYSIPLWCSCYRLQYTLWCSGYCNYSIPLRCSCIYHIPLRCSGYRIPYDVQVTTIYH